MAGTMAPPMHQLHTDATRASYRSRSMSLLSNVSTTSGRILVVDDDAGARDLIVSSLRADGHEVDASGSGIEALRMLGREWYDLIVSNLRMPELDGPSLYSAVSRRWPAQPPPMLFLAGLGGTSDYDGFIKVIRAHVLPKPFTIRALRRAIKEML
jgi:DNA-binding response OmpR family regulator